MNDLFRTAVDALLHEVTPSGGVATLLYRHPFGGAFFPLAVRISPRLSSHEWNPHPHYHLLSTQLDPTCLEAGEVSIGADDSAESLVRQGKLAVRLFDRTSLQLKLHPYEFDAEQRLVLAIIGPADGELHAPRDGILRAAVYTARAWIHANERLFSVSGSGEAEVLASAQRLFEDREPDPPFFPILHARIHKIVTRRGQRLQPVGALRANALAYNCALAGLSEKLRASYIDDMFRRAADEPCFVHPIPEDADALARAVNGICDDYVCKLAVSTASGATLCGRFNVPRHCALNARERWSLDHAECFEVSSDWELVRRGIDKLIRGDDNSALITAWIGRLVDGEVEYAIPIGFAPGAQQHHLADVARTQELEPRRRTVSGIRDTVEVEVIKLNDSEAAPWPATKILMKRLAAEAEEQIEAASAPFPPPYELDFFGRRLAKQDLPQPLHIRSVTKSGSTPMVFASSDKVYLFLLMLCRAKEISDGLMTHAEVAVMLWGTEASGWPKKTIARKVDDDVRTQLRKRIKNKEDLKQLYFNVKGKGWRLAAGAEAIGLTRDVLDRVWGQCAAEMAASATERIAGSSVGRVVRPPRSGGLSGDD